MLGGFGGGWVGESEDVLGEREERILRILGIGTHLELQSRVSKMVDGGLSRDS